MNSASSPWKTNGRRVRVGRRGQSGRGTAVDGAKQTPRDGATLLGRRVFRQRHVVIAIGTGEGSRREGSAPARARLRAVGLCPRAGRPRSSVALGRVAGGVRPGRIDDDAGCPVFFVPKPGRHVKKIRWCETSRRGAVENKKLPTLQDVFQTSPPSATRTRVKLNRTAFVLYVSDAPIHTSIPCSRTSAAAPRTTPAPRESPLRQSPATCDPQSTVPCTPVPTGESWTPVVPRRA